jgi:hypothetical protein
MWTRADMGAVSGNGSQVVATAIALVAASHDLCSHAARLTERVDRKCAGHTKRDERAEPEARKARRYYPGRARRVVVRMRETSHGSLLSSDQGRHHQEQGSTNAGG